MTVGENIGFHLRISKGPRDQIEQRVRETAALLDLEEFLCRKPAKVIDSIPRSPGLGVWRCSVTPSAKWAVVDGRTVRWLRVVARLKARRRVWCPG